MTSMADFVHIGIVTYNSRDDLPACFAALAQQTYPNLRLTVLDNASQDGSAEWVAAQIPQAKLIRSNVNLGFARGHNRILSEQPEAAYYMALNPDVRLEPGYIAALVACLESTGAGWGTGKLLSADGSRIYSVGHGLYRGGYAVNIGYGLADNGQFEQMREVFGAPGAAPLYSRVLLADLTHHGEFFDADMFMYGEDTDVDWRARRAGWRCWYTPHAVAYHRGSAAQGRLRMQAVGNRYLSVLKNADPWDLWTYNLPLMLLHGLVRLVVSPVLGVSLIKQLTGKAARMLSKRRPTRVPPAEMRDWFRWSQEQPTGQPRSWAQRLRDFGMKKLLKTGES